MSEVMIKDFRQNVKEKELETNDRVITVPPGYKVILVPESAVPFHPDYDECKRQADLATGLEGPVGGWINVFTREINRWCWQAYGHIFQAGKPEGEVEDDLEVDEMFTRWEAAQKEPLTPRAAFNGAVSLIVTACRLGRRNQNLLVEAAEDIEKLRHRYKGDDAAMKVVTECLNSLLITVEKHK